MDYPIAPPRFKTGEELGNIIKSQCVGKDGVKLKSRDFVDSILSFCLDELYDERIGIVYGLRATGKTVGMLQAAERLIAQGHKVAFVRYNFEESGMLDANFEITKLAGEGYTHFFLDEAVYLGGFLKNCDSWPDMYAPQYRVKIVITGDDSFLLWLAREKTLYGRYVAFSTNCSNCHEFKRVLGKGYTDYKSQGGLFLEVENESALELFPGNPNASIEKFIEDAIVGNLARTLEQCNEDFFGNYYFDLLYAIEAPVLYKGVVSILKLAAEEGIRRSFIRDASKIQDFDAIIGNWPVPDMARLVEETGILQNRIKIGSFESSRDALIAYMVRVECLIESRSGVSDKAAMQKTLYFAQPALMSYAIAEAKRAIMEMAGVGKIDPASFSESLDQAADSALSENVVYAHLLLFADRQDVTFRYQDKEGREIDAVVINRNEKTLRLIEVRSQSRIDAARVFENEARCLYDGEALKNIAAPDDFSITRIIAHAGENELVSHEKGELFLLNIEKLLCRIKDLELFLSEVRGLEKS
ncbi:MAG: DUF4143 domain-containing protein [Clostridiales bacterium]|nr:DUF4143 domain-containing protein [Clostridiales bacterium]